MDREKIIAAMREKSGAGGPVGGLSGSSKTVEAISRLEAALKPPASFAELERELPPPIRYLGPGPWLDTIKALSKEEF
jgi:hypothetical protein